MPVLTSHAVQASTTSAVLAQLDARFVDGVPDTRIAFLFHDSLHDGEQLHAWASSVLGGAALIGGSSSGGVMTDKGPTGSGGVGLLLVDDPQGDYGVGSAVLGEEPAQAAQAALMKALDDADCPGQLPALIWVYQAPGSEEAVMAGLRQIVGDRCPIYGGSAADNDVSGRWTQMGSDGVLKEGVVVAALFPSAQIRQYFGGGYEPAGPSGVVTRVTDTRSAHEQAATSASGRDILEIDGEPAAVVYNRWIDGQIDRQLPSGGNVLADTTMFPLAVDAGMQDGITQYQLIHPESVSSDGQLRTFCSVDQGSRVFAMKGGTDRLVNRAGHVSAQARSALEAKGESVAGALVVFCGGCKMAVDDSIDKVAEEISVALGDVPFLACFTFGEQGLLNDRNVHGNLMISSVVFGA